MRTVVQSLFTAVVATTVAGCAAGSAGAGRAPGPARAVVDTVFVVDTVAATPLAPADALRAGRFDNGKMWTFEYPPTEALGTVKILAQYAVELGRHVVELA